MTYRKRLLACFNYFLSLSKIPQIWKYIKLISKHFSRFGTDNDFILRVAPLRDKEHDSYRNYFPPPCYGFPYGKTSQNIKNPPDNYQKYGLFLWPDRLYKDITYFSILLISTLIPFFVLLYYGENNTKLISPYYVIIILLFIAAFVKIIFIVTANKTLPVLHKIWALWPESHYDRFLNVPHLSDIAKEDEKKDRNKYWKPDKGSPLSHQPSYYAKGKNTLQEVILHLAIFDYLFYPSESNNFSEKEKKEKKNKYKKSLKIKSWLYLFSPAIISYIILLFSFFISALFYPTVESIKEIPVLLRYPFWYAPLIIIWFAITVNMILKQISFLEQLQEEIRNGYYNAHLDLIPQQILSVVAKVPSEKQISRGIKQVESILRWSQAAALVTFFMLLEVFSSGFS